MEPELEAHLRSLVNFPSPTGVATHIIALAKDPDIEMGKVAKALSLDSALSTKILRIANSPLYAQRRKSENLRQSLVVLGLNATLTLALSFTLVKNLRGRKSQGLDYLYYWRRSLLSATAARALADAMHQPTAEEVFLAALLQDVGMLALDQTLPDLYAGADPMQHGHEALAALEVKRVQADHATVGAWLMRSWQLPERLCLAVANSHRCEQAYTTDPWQVFERCVALSGSIADLFLQDPGRRDFADAAQAAERSLGLDRMAFGQVLATLGAMIPETEALFEAEPLASQHPELILEQAREVLMLRNLQVVSEISALRAAAQNADSRTLELEEETRRDSLTGAYNRAYLDLVLNREFESAARHGWPLSVAFADLDQFKRVNDAYGHQAGDRVLQATARLLRSNTRESDLVARYGGEEFVLILPATDAATARSVCERIVASFQNTTHVIGAEHAVVTISIGCATQGGPTLYSTPSELLAAADAALYAAKTRGRNRAVAFDRHLKPRARAAMS